MEGMIKIGDQLLGKGGYFRAPAGLRVPQIDVQEGTDILLFRGIRGLGILCVRQRPVGFRVPRRQYSLG